MVAHHRIAEPGGDVESGPTVKMALIGSAVKQLVTYLLLFCSLSVLAPTAAFAQDVQGRNWAGACTGCHGSEGRRSGAIPSIAGMQKEKFVRLMMAFRDGAQPGTIMHQLARGLSDEQIEKIGDYFASRQPYSGSRQ